MPSKCSRGPNGLCGISLELRKILANCCFCRMSKKIKISIDVNIHVDTDNIVGSGGRLNRFTIFQIAERY